MAETASTEPDDRSMPPVMITCVTPMAMRPTMETCRIMTSRRCGLPEEALAAHRPAQRLEQQRDADQHEQDAEFVGQAAAAPALLRSAATIELVEWLHGVAPSWIGPGLSATPSVR